MLKTPIYTAWGVLLIAGYGWINYKSFGSGTATEQKVVPRTVRQNPGSYRPAYGYGGYHGPAHGGYGGGFPTGK
ncbi:MAG: hypothetical protein FJW39_14910 [Acidobacteria bacterium]|nr:hypothetical protein [Acidobacteriota bacterium]